MDIYQVLSPLFIYPDRSVLARLGPDDVHRTVSYPLFNFNCVFRLNSRLYLLTHIFLDDSLSGTP